MLHFYNAHSNSIQLILTQKNHFTFDKQNTLFSIIINVPFHSMTLLYPRWNSSAIQPNPYTLLCIVTNWCSHPYCSASTALQHICCALLHQRQESNWRCPVLLVSMFGQQTYKAIIYTSYWSRGSLSPHL